VSAVATTSATLVEAPWVLPIVRPPIEDGAVLVDGEGVVLAVGRRRDVRARAPLGTRRVFAGDVVLPALVNAHLHLELSCLARAGLPRGEGLVAWVRALIAKRASLDAASVSAGLGAALDELRAAGIGALGDVTSGLAGGEIPTSAPFEGLRFHEALGARPEDAERVLADARGRAARDAGPLRVALAAHSPATCSEPLLRAIAETPGPISLHLAEDPAERRLLAQGDGAWASLLAERSLPVPSGGGLSPVALAVRLGLLSERTLAVHCVDVDEADIAILARSRATVLLCPRSNHFLGLPAAPAAALLAAGARLALGTDSLASSPSLSILEEAAALGLPAARSLEAATLGGAHALGLAHRGAIASGLRPGLIALDVVVGRRRPEEAILEQPRAEVTWP